MFFAFFVSFVHIVLTGLLDALIKGNVMVYFNNDWARAPWYFKDENFIYPCFIGLVSFLAGVWLAKKNNFGWRYFIFWAVWLLGGLESLSYWLFISALGIGQTLWWLPDNSFFWWYPKTAPWLNNFLHLRWLSGSQSDVSRQAVLLASSVVAFLNLILAFSWRKK